jgi:organic hydroperoxide reductase OsmC/OhrA
VSTTTTAKAYDFPLTVRWVSGRRTLASAPGKHDLEVATPPEFKGGVAGVWSPEDLLVAATGSCFVVTLLAVAERRGIPLHRLEVDASGHVTRRNDGTFGFTEVVVRASVETESGFEHDLREATEIAERGCLVANSVDFPVRVEVDLRAPRLLEMPA